MQPFAFYLLKVIACSGILLLYYRLALRNKRFHYYNRFYLLMAMAASLLLPLLKFNWFTVEGNGKAITLLGAINAQGGDVYTNARHGLSFDLINWQLMFAIIYIGISFFLMAVLLSRIIKIYRLKKKYGVVNMAEFDFINTDIAQAPFSFLHNLFWRDDIDMNEATGRQVLQHELTHIRQKHTWDKLWMQVITSVLWINPFFWFIQKELYMLHEFIADEKAIENNDGAAFAAMLLTSQYGKNIFSPAQQFSYSPIKRRLFMLTNLTKPRYSYARRLMVLPLLATMVLLFAFRLKANTKNTQPNSSTVAGTSAEVHDTVKDDDNPPSMQGASVNFADTTKPLPLFVLNGNIVEKAAIEVLKPNDIENIIVLKGKTATDKYGEQSANGVIEITTKNDSSSQPTNTLKNKGTGDIVITDRFDKNNISGLIPVPLYAVGGKIMKLFRLL